MTLIYFSVEKIMFHCIDLYRVDLYCADLYCADLYYVNLCVHIDGLNYVIRNIVPWFRIQIDVDRVSELRWALQVFKLILKLRHSIYLFILLFYFIWDIYHPYRKVMNQNVLQGSAPYKIEQRPFTVKLNWKKCLKFHSNIVYQIEQMSF